MNQTTNNNRVEVPRSKSSRRQFLRAIGAAGAGTLITRNGVALSLDKLKAYDVENPLAAYPDVEWEKVYRDQYKFDRSFTFACSPNDTHQCRLRAYVRNGIVTRIEQPYDCEKALDLQGNHTAASWNPRGCLKGYTFMRRVYGPYRIKGPMVRKGWKEWIEADFPTDSNGLGDRKYFRRGEDEWLQLPWDEAQTLMAKAVHRILTTYGGEKGAALLKAQGYPPEMIEAMHGSAAQSIKCRAGMWLCGILQIGSLYRFANMLGIHDGKLGGRGWSNYDWHGDLPPGHPMVTGIQTFDPELDDFRNARLLIFIGKNMVENKMPEAHWWIESLERGGKVVNISPEYSPASQKSDYWVPIRPGSDVALLLGVCRILMEEKKYDGDFVRRFTDLPLLVRKDTGKLLKPDEVIPGYRNAPLRGYSVSTQKITPERREKWGDFCVWDGGANAPAPVSRDDVGDEFDDKGVNAVLEGVWKVKTVDGAEVEVTTVFQTYKELCSEYDLEMVEAVTGTPRQLVERLANDIATIKPVMIHGGEGINHYFHCDITTRAVFLPLALTGNIGKPGANVGHWAGNYKSAVFNGVGTYIAEDPLAIDQGKINKVLKMENICYWNYEDTPLIVDSPKHGRVCLTGKSHIPTPTKMMWAANVNLLNNAKWAYNMIANVDPKLEIIAHNEVEWTGSCEYADIVFPAQSWMECQQMNFTGSCANPFIQVWKGGIDPLYDSRPDGVIVAGVAEKLSEVTGDKRYREYFRYFLEDKPEVYAQRIFDASSTTKGYNVEELLASERGWLAMFRTLPRIPGYEQINESKPFYNKSGRLEFYRDEDEFLRLGENLIVHREPVEATPYLPNVIVSSHPLIRPDDYGFRLDDESVEARQARNVKMPWSEVKNTKSPLWEQGFQFYCLTPKTRHRVHSSWSGVDWNQIWDSNFGDPYRVDKRIPGVGEHQIQMNPDDAVGLGLADGDYVYVDANPEDRPYKGWNKDDPHYKISRLMLRVKFNPAYPRSVTMMKHSTWMATAKSVKAHETRSDGRAVAEDTGYQANLRYGSQQSITRGWLQPSQMTDSLVRKDIYGQNIGEGYEPDIHSPNTCPKETLVRITKAEDGNWKPGESGRTPGDVNAAMQAYLNGEFINL